MLDSLLKRENVLDFIENINRNDKYFNKKKDNIIDDSMYVSSEVALYIFYEALLKYKIIVDDDYLFDEYIDNLDKIYKKIDCFQDIREAINKLICKIVSIKLKIKDTNDISLKNEIIKYIYNKYIKEGYYIHGFSSSYKDKILGEGFLPEIYENYYEKFVKVKEIFAKYNVVNIISKDFTKNAVYFTDDIVRGCYYSTYSPMYFYNFLTNEDYFGKRYRKDSYLIDDYNNLISPLKRFMSDNLFSESDKKFILSLVKDEWDLLHRSDRKIELLLVRRDFINYKGNPNIDEYLNTNEDLFEVVDRLLSSKINNIYYKELIDSENLEVISLDLYYNKVDVSILEENERVERENKLKEANNEFLNDYGNTSYLLLLGSLFISLGVIISIIMILRG